ncbi:MAG: outer membrane protein assembly factor BamA [candidate division Zixibacteria bacterium]|nr:outer membrane protein assembly factor BamA [candidate division Zixibacteria bacterium]MDD5424970.1 outer membrane protein assembly factor BamA [candidate division Zixibacteria bacterium]
MMIPATTVSAQVKFKIDRVTFEGNRAYPDKRLLGLILSRPSGFLHSSTYYREILLDDIENLTLFYHQNGYLEAVVVDTIVTVDSTAARVDIHLKIDEGVQTHLEGIAIFGNTAFEDSLLRGKVRMKNGEPFRRSLIQEGMMSMLSLYAENGHLDAVIRPEIRINSDVHLAAVDFIVTERFPSTIAEIRVEGNVKTKPSVILRELTFRPGEIVRYSRLMASQRRLYLTGLFESVFIHPRPPANGDSTRRDIVIEIKENLSSEYNIAVGYGSVDKVRSRMEVFTRNLAGTARKIGTTLNASFIRRSIEGSFTEPWTLGTRWHTDINLRFEFIEEPGYDLSRYGGRLTTGRTLGNNTNLSFTYRFEEGELRHIEVADIPASYDPRVRSLILSLTYDTRDNLFNPTRGTYLEWTNELAGAFLKGNNTFARTGINMKCFWPVRRETVLGTALEIDWMDYFGSSEEIPLSERFYAGGPNSLRGFEYRKVGPLQNNDIPIGGNFKIIWNIAELRHTLYRMIGVVGFVEVGNVWSRARYFRLADLRGDTGVGLRVNTPLGIIRLDWGINLDPRPYEPRSRIYFNMGQAF